MRRIMLFTTFALLTLMIYAGPSRSNDQLAPVRVFASAKEQDPNQFSDPGSKYKYKQLKESLVELKKKLGKDKLVALVDDSGVADVVVEITSAEYRETGSLTTDTHERPVYSGGGLSSSTTKDKNMFVDLTLTSGDYSTTMEGADDTVADIFTFKRGGVYTAADDLASQVEKWIRDNNSKLIKRREASEKQ